MRINPQWATFSKFQSKSAPINYARAQRARNSRVFVYVCMYVKRAAGCRRKVGGCKLAAGPGLLIETSQSYFCRAKRPRRLRAIHKAIKDDRAVRPFIVYVYEGTAIYIAVAFVHILVARCSDLEFICGGSLLSILSIYFCFNTVFQVRSGTFFTVT